MGKITTTASFNKLTGLSGLSGLFALVLFFPFYLSAQINHWETAINNPDLRRYKTGTAEPPVTWRQLAFNDLAWPQGAGGIGFGDNDDNTTVSNVPSVYMRIYFNIVDTSKIGEMLLNIDYDDGFIAFINDVEVARSNLGSVVGDHPPYNQFAEDQHEAMMYQGLMPEGYMIPKSLFGGVLLNGSNVLAIQVHNATANSPDLSSNLWLSLGITDFSTNYGPNPAWFYEPLSSSDLPLVVINTNGATIKDDPRIVTNMSIIWNGQGNRNFLSDPWNDYNGKISIEFRGSTSQQYPKKGYGLETQDALGNNNNVSLLGMPAENDWILYGPYPDKTLIRNVLTYDRFEKMGHYSPRTRYVELIINREYRGLYVLEEKIKRDQNRIDVPKLSPTDVSGDEITGGYLFKVDKTTGLGNPAWTSPYSADVFFQFHDPDETELVAVQKTWLENRVTAFETALNGPNFTDPLLGYRKYIDVNSFIDFMIMQELGRTVDGYRSSTFMHKTRDGSGGLIRMGPMWDFNLSFGNADYCQAYNTAGWQYNFNTICPGYTPEVPFWWARLVSDPAFSNDLRCRWDDLRMGLLHTDTLKAFIDDHVTLLQESRQRNFLRWPIIGTYVNWNYFVGNTYQEDVDYFKTWITNRSAWMDNNIGIPSPVCLLPQQGDLTLSEINYHPDTLTNNGDWIELFNGGLTSLDIGGWILKDDNPANSYILPQGTNIPAGTYLVICEDTSLFRSVYPLVNNFIGPFGFGLGNGGGKIRLYNPHWVEAISMEYSDNLPWPQLPDGNGYTLEVVNPFGDLSDPNNWVEGCPLGSPGQAYTPPCNPLGFYPESGSSEKEKDGIKIYPNPFSESLTIEVGSEICRRTQDFRVEMMDLTGRKVQQFESKGTCSFTINRFNLTAGIYIAKISTDNQILATRKLIAR